MPGTEKRENCMEKLLSYYFTCLFELKVAVKYQNQFLIPVTPLFNFKDFIIARDQKYRGIVFIYLSI